MASVANYKIRKCPENMVLHVNFKLVREFKIRKSIAGFLIKLAARILGCGIQFD